MRGTFKFGGRLGRARTLTEEYISTIGAQLLLLVLVVVVLVVLLVPPRLMTRIEIIPRLGTIVIN